MIIETGFNIFFLIKHYLDLDQRDIDVETSSQLNEIKQDFIQKNSLLMFFRMFKVFDLQNSVLGKIFSLFFSLIEYFYNSGKYLVSSVQKNILKMNATSTQQQKSEIKKRQFKELFREAVQFFVKHSGNIEILRQNQLEKVNFIMMPYCHYLPKETKNEFHEQVNRDSPEAKKQYLKDQANRIIYICKHEEKLALFFQRNKILSLFAGYVTLWKDLAYFITIIINIIILLSYQDHDERSDRLNSPHFNNLSTEDTKTIFRSLGIAMIVCSSFVVLFFVLKKAPIYWKEAWDQFQKYVKKEQSCLIRLIKYFFIILISILKVIMNLDVLYYLAYGLFAFIATYVHPFFFAFHLTEFLIRYQTLKNIIKSAWQPKAMLGLTFLLVILFTYYFTIWAYMSFFPAFFGRCESLYMCLVESFDQTYKSNGGLGGWLENNEEKQARNQLLQRTSHTHTRP